MRREGSYSSHLGECHKAPDGGAVAGLSPAAKSGWTSADQLENTKNKACVEHAERELARTKAA